MRAMHLVSDKCKQQFPSQGMVLERSRPDSALCWSNIQRINGVLSGYWTLFYVISFIHFTLQRSWNVLRFYNTSLSIVCWTALASYWSCSSWLSCCSWGISRNSSSGYTSLLPMINSWLEQIFQYTISPFSSPCVQDFQTLMMFCLYSVTQNR